METPDLKSKIDIVATALRLAQELGLDIEETFDAMEFTAAQLGGTIHRVDHCPVCGEEWGAHSSCDIWAGWAFPDPPPGVNEPEGSIPILSVVGACHSTCVTDIKDEQEIFNLIYAEALKDSGVVGYDNETEGEVKVKAIKNKTVFIGRVHEA